MAKIKVVIFDFDDTLYRGTDWTAWGQFVEDFLTELLKTRDKAKKFMKKHNFSYATLGSEIVRVLNEEFGTAESFVKYQEENIYPLTLDTIRHIENEQLKCLSEVAKLYIVSNSSIRYVKHYLKKFGIEESNFEAIYQNDFLSKNTSKAVKYQKILNDEGVLPEESMVLGDNYKNDIEPALLLGMRGEWIKSLEEVQEKIASIIEEHS